MSAPLRWDPRELGELYVCDSCGCLVSVKKRGGPYQATVGVGDRPRFGWDLCVLCAQRLMHGGVLEPKEAPCPGKV